MRSVLHLLSALLVGVVVGWLSAIGAISNLGFASIKDEPYWQQRQNGREQFAAPYALAYFTNAGQVPPPTTTRFFQRGVDEEGATLDGSCVYTMTGRITPARNWMVGADFGDGARITLNAGQLILGPDGAFTLAFSPYPVPGNRIDTADQGRMSIVIVVHEAVQGEGAEDAALPRVTKVRC